MVLPASKTKIPLKRSLYPMKRVIPITEQFQHFLREVNENFWGELYRRTALAWKSLFEELSWKERDRCFRSEGIRAGGRAGMSQWIL